MVKTIERIFSEVTGMTDLNFTEKTKFDKITKVSSLSMIQLVCALEDEFDIEIPNSEIKKFKAVKDVVKFLEKNTNK